VKPLPLICDPLGHLNADAFVSIRVETGGNPQELVALDLEGSGSRAVFCAVAKVTVALVRKWCLLVVAGVDGCENARKDGGKAW
jgi:hypothetical protein